MQSVVHQTLTRRVPGSNPVLGVICCGLEQVTFPQLRPKKNKNVSGNMLEKKWVDRSGFFFFLGKPYHVKYLNIDIQFNQN